MEIRTGCKINLGLEITGVLPNGYHTLDSVFYPLARPFDVLEVERREAASACPAIPPESTWSTTP